MRKILQLTVEGCRIVGTAHLPHDTLGEGPTSGPRAPRVGLLLFNSGFLPRSPVGDLTTHLADHFAAAGMPSFRFDMPGLGDSDGDLPEDVKTFFAWVLAGGHGAAAAAVARHLTRQFDLSGIVLGGFCGGAVTSVYAAARGEDVPVTGVVLLDPTFQLNDSPKQQKKRPGQSAGQSVTSAIGRTSRDVYQRLRLRLLQTEAGERARQRYLRVKASIKSLLSLWRKRELLPGSPNRLLISTTQKLRDRAVPMLAVMAGGEQQHTQGSSYLRYIAGGRTSFSYRYLPDTTHSFVEGDGEARVTELIEEWLLSLRVTLRPRADRNLEPVALETGNE